MKLTEDKGVKIFKKEKQWNGGSFFVYSMAVASKDRDGNWVNGYIDCNFKSADANKITNKCKIKINNAFPTVTKSGDRTYVKWMITEFEVVEAGEVVDESNLNVDEFMNIPDNIDDEIPFA